ncbi:mitochondrial sodium/calcium exchanger protein-like [Culicoides brevitarsis]|uniref:mitochondrial sodium/calcium exchanger protein-like n=1 Tax=Culicoides brevitarsis TaxID=469753 RepID=UPI00307C10CE
MFVIIFIILGFQSVFGHPSYVSLLMQSRCLEVHSLEAHQKCEFVKKTDDCHIEARLFYYSNFVYCAFGEFAETRFGQILNQIGLILWCVLLFLILSVVSDSFFCPGLASISKMFRLSENIAGVTLLAFGNGAPNFSGSIFDPDTDSELMYSETLGSTMFMIGGIAGLIAIVSPFQVIPKDFMRDAVFLVISVALVQGLIADEHYSWLDAILTIGLYVIYLAYVFIEYHFEKKRVKKQIGQISLTEVMPYMHLTSIRPEIQAQMRRIEELLQFQLVDKDNEVIDINATRQQSILPQGSMRRRDANYRLFQFAFEELNPKREFQAKPLWKLPFEIFQAILLFVLRFVLPIFDYTADRHGWNKLLNIIHIFTLPIVTLEITMVSDETFFDISILIYSLSISLGLASVVFVTSRTDRPPRYHFFFAFLNFFGCNLIIFAASSELASVLNTLGLVFNCTASIIGVTVLAIGNSVSDVLANVTLARQGHQRMAFAACFGGSIFNILFTIGFTFLSKAFESPDYNPYARRGPLGLNCIIYIILTIIFLFLLLSVSQFQVRRTFGYMLVVIYVIFISQCILSEMEFIHSYGTDHHNEEIFD